MSLHLGAKWPYLKSAAVASPRACCLSIIRLFTLRTQLKKKKTLLVLMAAGLRSSAHFLPRFASSLCEWRPFKKMGVIDLHCFGGKLNFCATMQCVPDVEEPCAVWDNETCSEFVQIVSTAFAETKQNEKTKERLHKVPFIYSGGVTS